MSAIDLRGVSKSYGDGAGRVDALVAVDLVVAPGSLVAVMGPSGSGKTTLLTIAGAMEEPSAGQVLIDGHDLANLSANERAALRRRTVGYVFQEFNLLAGLTRSRTSPSRSSSTASVRSGRGQPAWRRSTGWACATRRTGSPTISPAASASGSPSPERSWATGTSSSPTSRRAPSTR